MRIGVFVCRCGPNIADRLDTAALVAAALDMEDVVHAAAHDLPCSEPGRQELVQAIEKNKLERIVVAGCSPRDHEQTFMGVCEHAGLNPYAVQMINIREHCAWVIEDSKEATQKAIHLIRAGIRRVALHQPLEKREMECVSDVLVIGAGIAGMEAALDLAQKDRTVYLVEQSPAIGGHSVRYEDVYPAMECAACMLEPKMDEVLHKENIKLMTCTRVEEVVGFYGNFTIRLRRRARSVDGEACLGCGECARACPVSTDNEFDEGLGQRKAIYIPYPGALPNVSVLDRKHCLRSKGENCRKCEEACPFGAVKLDQEDRIEEIKVGSVVLATGFDAFDPSAIPELGYGRIDEVYTSLEFERLLSATGPTEGRIVMKNGKEPESIAFVHCVGSRSAEHIPYCTGLCCLYALKFAHLARKKLPGVHCVDIHQVLTLPGKDSCDLLHGEMKDGLEMIRTDSIHNISIREADGKCVLTLPEKGDPREITADMVVLAVAMTPAKGTGELAELFGLPLDRFGFFQEEHGRLSPMSTNVGGVYVAGCAQGPKDIPASVAHAAAAAGRVLSKLIKGEKLQLESITAHADADRCGGCKTCISMCPFKAITYDSEKKAAQVNEALCKGCGTCAAACPSGAMESRHFTVQQLFAEIEGLCE